MTSKKSPAARAPLRSPAYPCLTLDKAIARAYQLFRGVGTKETSPAGVARAWGNSSAAGKILSYITALREYGLTVEHGRGDARRIQLSELGTMLVRQSPSVDLLAKAALNPLPFRQLWNEIKTGKSANEKDAVRILCSERQKSGLLPFTESGALEAFRIFRLNVGYARLRDDDEPIQSSEQVSSSQEDDGQAATDTPEQNVGRMISTAGYRVLEGSFNSGRDAKILYPRRATRDELEAFKLLLQAALLQVDGELNS